MNDNPIVRRFQL